MSRDAKGEQDTEALAERIHDVMTASVEKIGVQAFYGKAAPRAESQDTVTIERAYEAAQRLINSPSTTTTARDAAFPPILATTMTLIGAPEQRRHCEPALCSTRTQ